MVDVPTTEQFNALEARVKALEEGYAGEPIDPPVTPGAGAQAKRAKDLLEKFGVNTFSSLDDGNLWGSWPANYSPDSVIAALKYLTADTKYAISVREYHYNGRQDMQRQWFHAITQHFPRMTNTICVGANGSVNDVDSMLSLAHDPNCLIGYVEGLNEPNTDFGSGTIPVEQTLDIQNSVWVNSNTTLTVMGPSIVAGTPHPEGWITGYCGDKMEDINHALDWGNGHYYPPNNPDVPNTGYSVDEYIGGLWTAYGQHPIALTEFHPTLYGQEKGEELEAYYTLLTLLRVAKNGTMFLWWYALYDYGSTYQCGLFPKQNADEPRKAAQVLRNLFALLADDGDLNFAPEKLEVEVDSCDWDLYQLSDGRFIIPLWNAAASVEAHIEFKQNWSIEEYDLLTMQKVQDIADDNGCFVTVNNTVKLLVVT